MSAMKRAVYLVISMLCAGHVAQAQVEFHPMGQVFIGSEPFRMRAKTISIETGPELDASGVPSVFEFDQKAGENAVTFGGRLGVLVFAPDQPFRMNFLLEGALNVFSSSFNSVSGALVFEPEYRREGSPVAPFLGIGLHGYSIWGDMGTVGGTDENDYFLLAPDGHSYPAGSPMTVVSNFLVGLTTRMGIKIYTGDYNHVFLMAGYQIASVAETWNFHLEDADDPDITYRIPDRYMTDRPEPVKLDGVFFRAGFSFTP